MDSIGSAVMGANHGMNIVAQRNQKLQDLQEQKALTASKEQRAQETHDQNSRLTDMKLDALQQKLDQTTKAIAQKDTYDGIDALIHKDTSVVNRLLKTNPSISEAFNGATSISKATDLNDFKGMEDSILLENGFKSKDLDGMTQEDKVKAIHEFGDDTYILTGKDGSLHTTHLEELSAYTGYMANVSKAKRTALSKAIAAGGLKRGLAQAIANGDTETADKLREAIKLTEKPKSSTNGDKPSAKRKDAEYIVGAQHPELNPGSPEYKAKVADQMLSTASTHTKDIEASVASQRAEVANDITNASTPSALEAISKTSRYQRVLKNEADDLAKDRVYKKSLDDFVGTVTAIKQVGTVLDSISINNISDSAIKKGLDGVDNILGIGNDNKYKQDSEYWATNPDKKATYMSGAEQAADNIETRGISRNLLQFATLAVIKSMSGLAVSDDERKNYLSLMASNNTATTQKVFMAARAFIMSKRTELEAGLHGMSQQYPIHAALYTKQLDHVLTTAKQAPSKAAKVEQEQQAVKHAKLVSKEVQQALTGLFGGSN